MRDLPWGGGNLVPSDFADADDIAVRGRDEYLVGRVEIFGPQGVLDDGNARLGCNFKEDAARYAFQAARVQRRSVNLAVLDCKDIRGGAFGDFAPLVEQNDFVETF